MNEAAAHLRDRRRQAWECARDVADEAAAENRYFTAEEQGTWEVFNEEIDTLDVRIKSVLDAAHRWQQLGQPGFTSGVTRCLRDRRGQVWEAVVAIAGESASQARAFTAGEQDRWAVLVEELAALDERIFGASEVDARAAEADRAMAEIEAREDRPGDQVRRLRDRRRNVWEHWKALAEEAATGERVFTPREQGAYEALREEFDRVTAQLTARLAGGQPGG